MFLQLIVLISITRASFQFQLEEKFIANTSSSKLCPTVLSVVKDSAFRSTVNIITSKEFICEEISPTPDVPFTVETINGIKEMRSRRHFSIVLLHSVKEFNNFKSKLTSTLFNFQGNFLIALQKGSLELVTEIFKSFFILQILDVKILYRENSSISLYTFLPFTSNKCDDATPVLINKFEGGKLLKSDQKLIMEKALNLNGCPVRIATSNNSVPYVLQHHFSNGSYHLYGRDISLIETLSTVLNFTLNYTFVGNEGALFKNGSAEGPFLSLLQNKADIIVADFWLIAFRLNFFDSTVPYFSQQIAFVIPKGDEFSSIEKFMRPLDKMTWIMLTTCIIIGLFVIFVVERLSKNLQNLLFGVGVNQPYLNILVALIGGSQYKSPRNNFARYLLMVFVMFCLVMRTIYTGSLYRMLQEKVYHNEVQSMADMIERNYTIYHIDSLTDLFTGAQSPLKDR